MFHTSLLTAVDSRKHVHLIIGTNSLAATRCSQSLAVGAWPILVSAPRSPESPSQPAALPAALQRHVESGAVPWVRTSKRSASQSTSQSTSQNTSKDMSESTSDNPDDSGFCDDHLFTLGRAEVGHVVDAVFVTQDISPGRSASARIAALCRRHRIPVNVADQPRLCTFALLSTHNDGPLQVGVTTNGSGCRLAARIRREVAAALPAGLGDSCVRLGALRRRIQAEDGCPAKTSTSAPNHSGPPDVEDDDTPDQSASFNQLVPEITTDTSAAATAAAGAAAAEAARTRRMRWLSQMCEYWPLKRLAAVTDADVEALLTSYGAQAEETQKLAPSPASASSPSAGCVILAGSGPGHPDLLTRAVHQAILSADLVLADKLVPQGVLDLIPRHTEVAIARKFPGNAEAAQDELVAAAVAGARAGRVVLRLKQGDPFVYGRGGEEVLRLREAFQERGDGQAGEAGAPKIIVLPGITSALSAPLFAGIPPTHRDSADQILICTGTGKKGVAPRPPGYRPSRTAVFLMALHRIRGLVAELTTQTEAEAEAETKDRQDRQERRTWPLSTPCAVIERASCPDQKVIRTTLQYVAAAIEQEGSRPPGLLVVGRACHVLVPDEDRKQMQTSDKPWMVEDGFAGFGLEDMAARVRMA